MKDEEAVKQQAPVAWHRDILPDSPFARFVEHSAYQHHANTTNYNIARYLPDVCVSLSPLCITCENQQLFKENTNDNLLSNI